jgi:hypothetical protein
MTAKLQKCFNYVRTAPVCFVVGGNERIIELHFVMCAGKAFKTAFIATTANNYYSVENVCVTTVTLAENYYC